MAQAGSWKDTKGSEKTCLCASPQREKKKKQKPLHGHGKKCVVGKEEGINEIHDRNIDLQRICELLSSCTKTCSVKGIKTITTCCSTPYVRMIYTCEY